MKVKVFSFFFSLTMNGTIKLNCLLSLKLTPIKRLGLLALTPLDSNARFGFVCETNNIFVRFARKQLGRLSVSSIMRVSSLLSSTMRRYRIKFVSMLSVFANIRLRVGI